MNFKKSDIRVLQSDMKRGILSSREIVTECLRKIAEFDCGENGLNSVAEINPDALDIAGRMDLEREQGKIRSAMHGIPVMLKDNINTHDRMHTTAGSLALADNYAPYDAALVTNLRKAGAVIIGKTNLTEFANYMTKGMPGGYSSRGGQVICYNDRKRNPSGSSAGSAVAVSAGLCPVAVGTETSGSIISPAWTNSIVGIKPSKGLVPGSGIIPIAPTLDTPGPMANLVSNAAILLDAMADRSPEFANETGNASTAGRRIGINRAHLRDCSVDDQKAFEEIIKMLVDTGIETVELPDMNFTKAMGSIFICEYKAAMNYYLSTLSPGYKIKTMKDIVAFNKANKIKTLKYGQSRLLEAVYFTSGRMVEEKYLKAIVAREEKIKELNSLMDEYRIEAIFHAVFFNNLAAFTGFPSITVPLKNIHGDRPSGMNLMGRQNGDRELISLSAGIEKATL